MYISVWPYGPVFWKIMFEVCNFSKIIFHGNAPDLSIFVPELCQIRCFFMIVNIFKIVTEKYFVDSVQIKYLILFLSTTNPLPLSRQVFITHPPSPPTPPLRLADRMTTSHSLAETLLLSSVPTASTATDEDNAVE